MVPTYAVIPTHNRREQLVSLVASLRGNVDRAIVVDNASSPAMQLSDFAELHSGTEVSLLYDSEQPPNLYRLWNVAFNVAELFASMVDAKEWNVAVFNDDTVLPSGWVQAVSQALRASLAVVACGSENHSQTAPILKTQLQRFPRMTPHAFMMKGEAHLAADESFRWWWGDSDFDFQAVRAGGVLIIPGYVAVNSCANSTTVGALAEQAGRDGQTFAAKWGGQY